jgi:hypothetical protein
MKLFVRIDGLSPFVLQLHDGLQIEHYQQITEQYYSELYQNMPPGNIYLKKVVNFKSGDKLMEFKRQESIKKSIIS